METESERETETERETERERDGDSTSSIGLLLLAPVVRCQCVLGRVYGLRPQRAGQLLDVSLPALPTQPPPPHESVRGERQQRAAHGGTRHRFSHSGLQRQRRPAVGHVLSLSLSASLPPCYADAYAACSRVDAATQVLERLDSVGHWRSDTRVHDITGEGYTRDRGAVRFRPRHQREVKEAVEATRSHVPVYRHAEHSTRTPCTVSPTAPSISGSRGAGRDADHLEVAGGGHTQEVAAAVAVAVAVCGTIQRVGGGVLRCDGVPREKVHRAARG